MKRTFGLLLVCVLFFAAMACSISYNGLAVGDDERPKDIFDEMHEEATMDTLLGQMTEAPQVESTPESGHQAAAPASAPAVASAGSEAEQSVSGSHEYSVASTNFNCVCQETGNTTVDFKFTGEQVEITNSGGTPVVYNKVADNQYQMTKMGYYILVEGEGDAAMETKVERDNRTVITLTDNGYVMENFQGEDSSPCCYFTFTKMQ